MAMDEQDLELLVHRLMRVAEHLDKATERLTAFQEREPEPVPPADDGLWSRRAK